MITVGVTGPIGSGKSTFCRIWEFLGAKVVYADDLAKELMVKDQTLINKIKSVFGVESYFSDGSLNIRHLTDQAFKYGRSKELNELVHPVLFVKTAEIIAAEKSVNTQLFVKEAALLLNYGRPKDLNYVIMVTSTQKRRLNRVKKRNGWTNDIFEERNSLQPDFEKQKALCDFVIDNNASLSELENKSRNMFFHITGQ